MAFLHLPYRPTPGEERQRVFALGGTARRHVPYRSKRRRRLFASSPPRATAPYSSAEKNRPGERAKKTCSAAAVKNLLKCLTGIVQLCILQVDSRHRLSASLVIFGDQRERRDLEELPRRQPGWPAWQRGRYEAPQNGSYAPDLRNRQKMPVITCSTSSCVEARSEKSGKRRRLAPPE